METKLTALNLPTKRPKKDMHPADIKAALEKSGYTFTRVAKEHGYQRNSPSNVLRIPWGPVEKIVGEIIGLHPAAIWPSRYNLDGTPIRSRNKTKKAQILS